MERNQIDPLVVAFWSCRSVPWVAVAQPPADDATRRCRSFRATTLYFERTLVPRNTMQSMEWRAGDTEEGNIMPHGNYLFNISHFSCSTQELRSSIKWIWYLHLFHTLQANLLNVPGRRDWERDIIYWWEYVDSFNKDKVGRNTINIPQKKIRTTYIWRKRIKLKLKRLIFVLTLRVVFRRGEMSAITSY